jgi:AmmeMemoRadiSam system protein B
LDTDEFREYLKKTDNTICGCQPIIVGMQALKRVGGYEGKLIKYA